MVLSTRRRTTRFTDSRPRLLPRSVNSVRQALYTRPWRSEISQTLVGLNDIDSILSSQYDPLVGELSQIASNLPAETANCFAVQNYRTNRHRDSLLESELLF